MEDQIQNTKIGQQNLVEKTGNIAGKPQPADINPDFIPERNNKSLLNAATIALDAKPKDMWRRSNFPERSTQKKNMMKKVNTKGATAERFLVVLRELMRIYQRFTVLKSPQANPRDPVDSVIQILNRSVK
jgi:hypothetical protein